MCILLKLHYALMLLDCFVQKFSKETFGGSARPPPLGKGRVKQTMGANQYVSCPLFCNDNSSTTLFLIQGKTLTRREIFKAGGPTRQKKDLTNAHVVSQINTHDILFMEKM